MAGVDAVGGEPVVEFVGRPPQPAQVRHRRLAAAGQGIGVQGAGTQDELRRGGVLFGAGPHRQRPRPCARGPQPARPAARRLHHDARAAVQAPADPDGAADRRGQGRRPRRRRRAGRRRTPSHGLGRVPPEPACRRRPGPGALGPGQRPAGALRGPHPAAGRPPQRPGAHRRPEDGTDGSDGRQRRRGPAADRLPAGHAPRRGPPPPGHRGLRQPGHQEAGARRRLPVRAGPGEARTGPRGGRHRSDVRGERRRAGSSAAEAEAPGAVHCPAGRALDSRVPRAGLLREYLGDPTLQVSHNERYGWSLAAGKVPDAINALKGTERRSAVHIAKALLGRASMVVKTLTRTLPPPTSRQRRRRLNPSPSRRPTSTRPCSRPTRTPPRSRISRSGSGSRRCAVRSATWSVS